MKGSGESLGKSSKNKNSKKKKALLKTMSSEVQNVTPTPIFASQELPLRESEIKEGSESEFYSFPSSEASFLSSVKNEKAKKGFTQKQSNKTSLNDEKVEETLMEEWNEERSKKSTQEKKQMKKLRDKLIVDLVRYYFLGERWENEKMECEEDMKVNKCGEEESKANEEIINSKKKKKKRKNNKHNSIVSNEVLTEQSQPEQQNEVETEEVQNSNYPDTSVQYSRNEFKQLVIEPISTKSKTLHEVTPMYLSSPNLPKINSHKISENESEILNENSLHYAISYNESSPDEESVESEAEEIIKVQGSPPQKSLTQSEPDFSIKLEPFSPPYCIGTKNILTSNITEFSAITENDDDLLVSKTSGFENSLINNSPIKHFRLSCKTQSPSIKLNEDLLESEQNFNEHQSKRVSNQQPQQIFLFDPISEIDDAFEINKDHEELIDFQESQYQEEHQEENNEHFAKNPNKILPKQLTETPPREYLNFSQKLPRQDKSQKKLEISKPLSGLDINVYDLNPLHLSKSSMIFLPDTKSCPIKYLQSVGQDQGNFPDLEHSWENGEEIETNLYECLKNERYINYDEVTEKFGQSQKDLIDETSFSPVSKNQSSPEKAGQKQLFQTEELRLFRPFIRKPKNLKSHEAKEINNSLDIIDGSFVLNKTDSRSAMIKHLQLDDTLHLNEPDFDEMLIDEANREIIDEYLGNRKDFVDSIREVDGNGSGNKSKSVKDYSKSSSKSRRRETSPDFELKIQKQFSFNTQFVSNKKPHKDDVKSDTPLKNVRNQGFESASVVNSISRYEGKTTDHRPSKDYDSNSISHEKNEEQSSRSKIKSQQIYQHQLFPISYSNFEGSNFNISENTRPEERNDQRQRYSHSPFEMNQTESRLSEQLNANKNKVPIILNQPQSQLYNYSSSQYNNGHMNTNYFPTNEKQQNFMDFSNQQKMNIRRSEDSVNSQFTNHHPHPYIVSETDPYRLGTKIIQINGSGRNAPVQGQDRKNVKIKIHLGKPAAHGNSFQLSQEGLTRVLHPDSSEFIPVSFGGIHKLTPLSQAKKIEYPNQSKETFIQNKPQPTKDIQFYNYLNNNHQNGTGGYHEMIESPMSQPNGIQRYNELRKIEKIKEYVDEVKDQYRQNFKYVEQRFKPTYPIHSNHEEYEFEKKSKTPTNQKGNASKEKDQRGLQERSEGKLKFTGLKNERIQFSNNGRTVSPISGAKKAGLTRWNYNSIENEKEQKKEILSKEKIHVTQNEQMLFPTNQRHWK